MKLIRIDDDRFVFDLGSDARHEQLELVRDAWNRWRESGDRERPDLFVIAGMSEPLVYEDRRETDLDSRLAAIEASLRRLEAR